MYRLNGTTVLFKVLWPSDVLGVQNSSFYMQFKKIRTLFFLLIHVKFASHTTHASHMKKIHL